MELSRDLVNLEGLSSNQISFLHHEEKVLCLETLSDLIGCRLTFPFHDGTVPDVVRINNSQSLLYIGDAKETESPRNKQTQKRLYSYLLWLTAFISRPGRRGVFAVCFKNAMDLEEWITTLQQLAKAANVRHLYIKSYQIDSETNMVWFSLSS